ncbi:MAG: hypothetical protein ACXQTJ_06320 [Candidatus Syntropharchaeales archaeon]
MSKWEREERAGRRAEFNEKSEAELDEWISRRDDAYWKQLKKKQEIAKRVGAIQQEKNKRNFGGI